MTDKSELPGMREIIERFGLKANRSLGQHFLYDLNITGKIARAVSNPQEAIVIEVGPGPGSLTRSLLERNPVRVIAVEKDLRFTPALEMLANAYPGKLELIHADALKIDEAELLGSQRATVVSNLPYNVGTQLLIKWLTADPWPSWYDRLVLMFQKEVADRIVAGPGSKAYGRLSVIAQWRCDVQRLFDVPAQAFVPPPKVDSSVVELIPDPTASDTELLKSLEAITAAAFGQRRKMLRANLKSVFANPVETLIALDIDPTARAETLGLDQFVALAGQHRLLMRA